MYEGGSLSGLPSEKSLGGSVKNKVFQNERSSFANIVPAAQSLQVMRKAWLLRCGVY